MSGYLQRLVQTVAGRGDSVHPRTGSIFSPRSEEIRPPQPEETEQLTTAQPRPRPHAMSPEQQPSEPTRSVRPGAEHAPLLPIAPDARSADYVPPRVPAAPRPAGAPVEPLDALPWEQPAEPSGSPLAAEADVDITVPAPAPGGVRDAFRPVMKPTRASDAVTGAAASRDMHRRHAARAGRQPDDIQIHIGRIEVIAVPPPAPRAPKPPDRSLSLDAYLSRRDGRAR